ncbi:MAG: hypothetical protein GQ558_03395, partial [Thermoplasmata archaeon]|nr:hypothetical protein [Thermoplasmata archaeon]
MNSFEEIEDTPVRIFNIKNVRESLLRDRIDMRPLHRDRMRLFKSNSLTVLHRYTFVVLLISIMISYGAINHPSESEDRHNMTDGSSSNSLASSANTSLIDTRHGFLENRGQIEASDVLFVSEIDNCRISFKPSHFVISFLLITNNDPLHHLSAIDIERDSPFQAKQTPLKVLNVQITFNGSNVIAPLGEDPLPGHYNYILGREPADWFVGVPSYQRIVYANIYDGIDLVYYFSEGKLKYDFIVHPGADPLDIRIHVEGSNGPITLDGGDISIHTRHGDLLDQGLRASYRDNPEEEVPSIFKLHSPNEYGFSLGPYDINRAIVIDPLLYSTFLGGDDNDWGRRIHVDSEGAIYLSGMSYSDDLPTTPGVVNRTHSGHYDLFVTKFSHDGSSLNFSTYIGGSDWDDLRDMYVDGDGNVFLTGWTMSADFPTSDESFQQNHSGGFNDAFVLKLSPDGTSLEYCTLLGGGGQEEGQAITVDVNGNAVITGSTSSTNFPISSNAYDPFINQKDVFITKMNDDGSDIVFSTFLGGGGYEHGSSIELKENGNIIICGNTSSNDFPIFGNVHQRNYGGGPSDGFIFELRSDGTRGVLSTFIGGEGPDSAMDLSLGEDGEVYLAGKTWSQRFPLTNGAHQRSLSGASDAFVCKFNGADLSMVFSTLFGGNGNETGRALAVDDHGFTYLVGETSSDDLVLTENSIHEDYQGGRYDAYICLLDQNGSTAPYTSYLGGQRIDYALSVYLYNNSYPVIGGYTGSSDFPTTENAYQRIHDFTMSMDAFAVLLQDVNPPSADAGSDLTIDQHETVKFIGTGSYDNVGIINWNWSFLYNN